MTNLKIDQDAYNPMFAPNADLDGTIAILEEYAEELQDFEITIDDTFNSTCDFALMQIRVAPEVETAKHEIGHVMAKGNHEEIAASWDGDTAGFFKWIIENDLDNSQEVAAELWRLGKV